MTWEVLTKQYSRGRYQYTKQQFQTKKEAEAYRATLGCTSELYEVTKQERNAE